MTRNEKAVIQAAIKWRNQPRNTPACAIAQYELKAAVDELIWTCDECNYDRHLCPGCGANLQHGDSTCEECAKL